MNLLTEQEKYILAPCAAFSSDSKGRLYPEPDDDQELRTCFMKDSQRIVFSNGYRRLKGKTQVFIAPKNDHFMNRLTHTFEVAQIARSIARCLSLNEDLTEAIALGHDIGHTPFGHAGEEALDEILKKKTGKRFKHEEESVRRLQYLEKRGSRKGLNLTYEVIDGIQEHSGFCNDPTAKTTEGQIVMFADKIAYLPSDMGNAITAGLLNDIPEPALEIGSSKSKIINAMVMDIIHNFDQKKIHMSDQMFRKTCEFRKYMFDNVYFSHWLRQEAEMAKHKVRTLFDFYNKNPRFIPEDYTDEDRIQNIVDYISSMTDNYADKMYEAIVTLQGSSY